jgi:MFS family permease
MIALTGFGVGGNMPVDGTLFLEFLPGSHQWLLTLLSVWWAIGQVVASLIAWGFLARWGCDTPPAGTFCHKQENMGWRYTYFTLGAMMIFLWVLRFFVMPVYESPKFLASIGRDADAVDVIHKIGKRNGVEVSLTVDDLRCAAAPYLDENKETDTASNGAAETKFSSWELFKHSFDNLSWSHLTALFATKRLTLSTLLVTFCYASLGLAYPLYNGFLGTYLAQKNSEIGNMDLNDTYASYTYQAACGIPGSILAAVLVDWSRTGRKFAMAIFTLCAGIFLFALTQAKTQVQVNALISIASFFENAFCEFFLRQGRTDTRRRAVRVRTGALPDSVTRHRGCNLCSCLTRHWPLCAHHCRLLERGQDAKRSSVRFCGHICRDIDRHGASSCRDAWPHCTVSQVACRHNAKIATLNPG